MTPAPNALAEAWEVTVTCPTLSPGYIAMAHAFVCHGDDSDCGMSCTADRERLEMLHVANEVWIEHIASPLVEACPDERLSSFERFCDAWAKRRRPQ